MKTVGIGAVLAAAAMLFIVFAPLQRTSSAMTGSDGVVVTSSTTQSLLQSQGGWVLVVAAFPVALTVLPLFAGWSRRPRLFRSLLVGSTVVLGLFVLVSGFSIGLFYVPALIALVAAAAQRPDRGTPPGVMVPDL